VIELNKIHLGDCLQGMGRVPDKSVHLIVIDPPYNIKKAKWDSWKTVAAYVEFMGKVFAECERVLKDNGSFYFFHNDFLQIVELQNWLALNTQFKYKQFITLHKPKYKVFAWKDRTEVCKDRNWFPNVEYVLYYTKPDVSGWDRTGLENVKLDPNNFKPLRDYFKALQDWIGLKLKHINTQLGHRRAEHGFYHSSTQWDLPTEQTYDELIEIFRIDVWAGFRTYESLREEYESLREEYESLREEYEKMRYVFNKSDNLSCVWEWLEGNSGKLHPTQKPLSTIEKIIEASSHEGDTVLDCFMGSGTTAIACINTNRNYIGFEKDETYHALATERVRKHQEVKSIQVPDLFSQTA
jgi:DNA modification methylase